MQYVREVTIPISAAEFTAIVIVDGIAQNGLVHVARRDGGTLHPAEFLYLDKSVTVPVKPHPDGKYSWDSNDVYAIKRMAFEGYRERPNSRRPCRRFFKRGRKTYTRKN